MIPYGVNCAACGTNAGMWKRQARLRERTQSPRKAGRQPLAREAESASKDMR